MSRIRTLSESFATTAGFTRITTGYSKDELPMLRRAIQQLGPEVEHCCVLHDNGTLSLWRKGAVGLEGEIDSED